MNTLDVQIDIEVYTSNSKTEYWINEIEIPYLNKKIEVEIPKTIRVGQRIRLQGLGYCDSYGVRGDLYLYVRSIDRISGGSKRVREKVFFVKDNDLSQVNKCLADGGKVKFIQPVAQNVSSGGEGYGDSGYVCAYIVVEIG